MIQSITIEIENGVREDYRRLIWEEFYSSRNRGISLAAHSPWLKNDNGVVSVFAMNSEKIIGGLILREYQSGNCMPVAMVGYVCVAPQFRHRGISKALLGAAIEYARCGGFGGLILWTKVPRVYEKFGFRGDGRDVLIKFNRLNDLHLIPAEEVQIKSASSVGIPAFANDVKCLRWGGGGVSQIITAEGISVGAWDGPEESVISLISTIATTPWWLNALSGDDLIDAIIRIRSPVDKLPSARYVLPFNGFNPEDFPGIRILDRI